LSTVPDKEIPSFEGLYKAHCLKVQRLCRMLLKDSAEAEETGQEVFLKMFKQYQTASWPNDWNAWLTRVTVNACHDRRKSAWWKWWRSILARCSSRTIRVLRTPEQQEAWGGAANSDWHALGNSPDGSKRYLF
jgi:DNA-directed RNA polymerase specialized sigma24 family protein